MNALAPALALLLVKTTLVLVAALALSRVLQRAAAGARHLVWLVALAALLAIPAVAAWAPLRIAALPPAATAAPSPLSSDPASASRPDAAPVPRTATPSLIPEPPTATPGASATSAAPAAGPRGGSLPSLTTLLLLGWALVVVLIAGVYVRGWFAVRRIVRGASPLADRGWLDTLYDASDRLALDEAPRLLRSPDATMPFACGIARPTIVLPAEADAWSAERRRAVLLHELAHVRRRDLVGHTFARFVCAVYWFHPLVWTAARHMRAESERACDDLALVCGEPAADYAEHLLDIVTSVRRDRTPLVALAMARRSEFEGRMLAILDPDRPRAVPRGRRVTVAGGGLAALALLVGAVAPVRRQAAARPGARQSSPPSVQAPAASGPRSAAQAAPAPRSLVVAPSGASIAAPPGPSTTGPTPEPRLDMRVDARVSRPLGAAAARSAGVDTSGDRAVLLAGILRADTSASIRRVAAWGLAEYGRSAAGTAALLAALRGDREAGVREMAAWALAESDGRGDGVAEVLAGALRDGDERVRATAAWALGNIGESGTAPALVRALADTSPRVRGRVVWALGNLDLREAPPALVALLRDPDPRTRLTTAWALYNIADPSTVGALQTALRAEKEQPVQVGELRALAALGDDSVEAIRELLDSPDPSVRTMAVRALAGGQAAGPWPWPWPEPRPNP